MTAKDAMYALYKSVEYICKRKIAGAFVECGVWKGGSALLAGLAARSFGDVSREIYLYDTFEGMTAPTEQDIDVNGDKAQDLIDTHGDSGKWCYAHRPEVERLFASFDLADSSHFIEGDVLDTISHTKPKEISLLRLDTDWYESTKFELDNLYDLIQPGGIVIIDDYGHWQGSRRAVDEFFSRAPFIMLHRVNYAVRLGIKI